MSLPPSDPNSPLCVLDEDSFLPSFFYISFYKNEWINPNEWSTLILVNGQQTASMRFQYKANWEKKNVFSKKQVLLSTLHKLLLEGKH